MDVQAYNDEAKFFLYLKDGALKEKIWITRLVSQDSIVRSVP